MYKSLSTFLALSVLCGACLADALIADSERARHKNEMDAAQDLKDEILEELDAKNGAKVIEPASKLVKFSEQEVRFWITTGVPGGVKIARENLTAAKSLQIAAKDGKTDRAIEAFAKLNDTCRSCHDLHLEKQWNTKNK
jgi:hypothetical protein